MLGFITIFGIAIGVLAFLYLLSAPDLVKSLAGKGDGKTDNGKDNPPRVNAGKILRQSSEPSKPRPRICPICGTVLAQDEYLMAALEPEPANGRKRQAHIYGCKYCLIEEGIVSKNKNITEIDL